MLDEAPEGRRFEEAPREGVNDFFRHDKPWEVTGVATIFGQAYI